MNVMPRIEGDETYMTTQEACDYLGVSRQTLNRYVNQGRVHQHKRGITRTVYYSKSELDRLSEIQPTEEQDR